MDEKVFTEGMIFKLPSGNSPDFVKGKLSFKVSEFKAFLDQHADNDWVNVDLLVGRSGKAYGALNTWKPDSQGGNYQQSSQPKQNFDSYQPPKEPVSDRFEDSIPF